MNEGYCETCTYFISHEAVTGDGYGLCCRFPPVPLSESEQRRPQVHKSTRCGEWEPVKKEADKKHRAEIERAVRADLIKVILEAGMDTGPIADSIIRALNSGRIRHVTINY